MDCREAQPLFDAYLDRELEAGLSASVAEHVDSCPNCSAIVQRSGALGAAARDLRQTVSPVFRDRVRSALRDVDESRQTRTLRFWRTGAIAASLLACAAISLSVLSQRHEQFALADQIVAAHVRSLMADHLVDVRSSNQHTVKPWFTGRVDFTADVRDFADEGFTLVGGRLDYIDHHPAIALVYQHDKHTINAFTWPGDIPRAIETVNGFHIKQWSDAGMSWCLVSDAGAPALQQLHELIEEKSLTSTPAK